MIIVDSREPQHIREYFDVFVDDARVEKLDCGDYLVNDILIERKTLADFNASCKSKRFFDQAYRLANEAANNDKVIVYALTEIMGTPGHELDLKLMSSIMASAQKRFGFSFIPFFEDSDFVNYVEKLDTLPKSRPKINPMYCLQPLLGNLNNIKRVDIVVHCTELKRRKDKVYGDNINVSYV